MIKLPPDVQQIIDAQVPKVLKREFNDAFNERFVALKEQMIQEFLTHPVTVEIQAGPTARNSSGTLGGVSNLFAFIGFEVETDPIAPILEELNKTSYRPSKPIASGQQFTVQLPSAQNIFSITPMPWANGRSWAKGIESGISGIGYLLTKQASNSRSGEAIQSKNPVRGGRFQNTPYISALLKKYEKEFSKLK